MAIIKLVKNGDSTREFRAVSLGHVVAVTFGLASIIVAQQTWVTAGAHEREMIVTAMRAQIVADITAHAAAEDNRLGQIDRRLEMLERQMDEAQRQININTGKIETWAGKK